MSNSNIFTYEQVDGNLFWSQIIPRPLDGGGFLFWYTDNEETEIIEFNKIISIMPYSSSKNSYKQILILVQFEDNFNVYRFGKFNNCDVFVSWLQQRVIY